jgi:hypothetical protein
VLFVLSDGRDPTIETLALGETQHSRSAAFGSRSLVGKYIVGATGEIPVSVRALPLLLALDTLDGIFLGTNGLERRSGS